MPVDAQSREFNLHVLKQLEALFDKDDLETLVAAPKFTPDHSIVPDSAVKVKHAIGIEAECNRFASQVQNKICCLVEILKKIDRK